MAALHPRLVADTVSVCRLGLCHVLLMKDANYPWLILVPDRENITEIFELEATDRATLTEEIAFVSSRLKTAFSADKINVAALGNMVPQLHVHVIARFQADPAWPSPVWGKVPAAPFGEGDLDRWLEGLRDILQP